MFRSSILKFTVLAAVAALLALGTTARANAASGGVMAAGYAYYGTTQQTYVNLGVTDNGPLAQIRYAGQIILYSPGKFVQGRVLGITYNGDDQAVISYIGLVNGFQITFGTITVSVTSPDAHQGAVGLNGPESTFAGNVNVAPIP